MTPVIRQLIAFVILFLSHVVFANCTSPTGISGAINWDSTNSKMRVCAGSTWTDTISTEGAACAQTNGTITYDNSNGNLSYCYNSVSYIMKGTSVNSCSSAGKFTYDSGISTYKYCNGIDNNWYRMTASASGGTFGYMVRTSTKWPGTLGGLTGANDKCLTELTTASIYWNGKDDAGTLTAARVQAWLCDGTNCQNPKANSVYKLAAASLTGPNTSTPGGATININSSGIGPGNADNWSGATFFGSATAYWTGRAAGTATDWPDSSSATNCVGWGNGTGGNNAMTGIGSATAARWSSATAACNSSQALICMVNPDANPGIINDCSGGCTEIYLTNTSLSSWTVPADWNNSNNKIEVIGGGGGGRSGVTSTSAGGGGGGGGYAVATNVSLTPGASVSIQIGTGGTGGAAPTAGGVTRFGGTDLASSFVGVNGGSAASGASTGGTGGTVVTGTGYSGGNGGAGKSTGGGGGGGGGGAGPNGAGKNGGGPSPTGAGSGGGGNGGGTHGLAAHPSDNSISGAGGNNASFAGGGAATTANSQAGNSGTDGGGGSGCSNNAAGTHAGHGGNGIEFLSSVGSGGGGGGGCFSVNDAGNGGNGGLYGAGGGGGGSSNTSGKLNGAGGNGSQGVIRITYTP